MSTTTEEELRKALQEATEKVARLQEANSALEQQLEEKNQNELILNQQLEQTMMKLKQTQQELEKKNTTQSAGVINLDEEDDDFKDLLAVDDKNDNNMYTKETTGHDDDVDSIDAAMMINNNNPEQQQQQQQQNTSYHPSRADSVDLDVGGVQSTNEKKKVSGNLEPPIREVGGDGPVLLDQHNLARQQQQQNQHQNNSENNSNNSVGGDMDSHSIHSNAATANSETPSLGIYFNNPQLANFIEDQVTNPLQLHEQQQQLESPAKDPDDHDEDDHEPRTKTYLDDEDEGDDHDPKAKTYYEDQEGTGTNEGKQHHADSQTQHSLLSDQENLRSNGRTMNMEEIEAALEKNNNKESTTAAKDSEHQNQQSNQIFARALTGSSSAGSATFSSQLGQSNNNTNINNIMTLGSQRSLSDGSATSSQVTNLLYSQQYSPSIISTDVSTLTSPSHTRLPPTLSLNGAGNANNNNNNPIIGVLPGGASSSTTAMEPATLMLENSSVASFQMDQSRPRFASMSGIGSQHSVVFDQDGNVVSIVPSGQQQHNQQQAGEEVTSTTTTGDQQQSTETKKSQQTGKDASSSTAADGDAEAKAKDAAKAEKKAKEKAAQIQYPENTKNIKTQTRVCRMQSVAVTASFSDILQTTMGGDSNNIIKNDTREKETGRNDDTQENQRDQHQLPLASTKLAQEHLNRLQGLLDHANSVVVKSEELTS